MSHALFSRFNWCFFISIPIALYGVIFPGESSAAFSNDRLWRSLGFAITYICSTILCIDSKITILVVFLTWGMAGYYVIEIQETRGGLKKDKEGKILPIDKLIINAIQVMTHSWVSLMIDGGEELFS